MVEKVLDLVPGEVSREMLQLSACLTLLVMRAGGHVHVKDLEAEMRKLAGHALMARTSESGEICLQIVAADSADGHGGGVH